MGKRKIHESTTYYQCEWTGVPMKASNCFMPVKDKNDKMQKRGCYANWECVVAHAKHMAEKMETTWDEFHYAMSKIEALVGTIVIAAPHYSTLDWFGGTQSIAEFHKDCVKYAVPVQAVRILSDGTVQEITCKADSIEQKFMPHLSCPTELLGPLHTPQSFQSLRRKGNKDRDVSVHYWPFKNGLLFNQTASNMFKMQIYGDVVITQQTREPSLFARDRFVDYTLELFNETSGSQKRKREPPALQNTEYSELKSEMQADLDAVEQRVSSAAETPLTLAKASVLPSASGKELARLAKAQALEARLTQPFPSHPTAPTRHLVPTEA